jgi:hypothetical protein
MHKTICLNSVSRWCLSHKLFCLSLNFPSCNPKLFSVMTFLMLQLLSLLLVLVINMQWMVNVKWRDLIPKQTKISKLLSPLHFYHSDKLTTSGLSTWSLSINSKH